MPTKTIQFYTRSVYGRNMDYIVNPGDARLLSLLTGQKTVTSVQRELVRDLSGGSIAFEQVLPPVTVKTN